MPQARITINAVPGSDDDLPIDTLVQLGNDDIGGETSYLWEILDQPEGPADSLSSVSAPNPTFTPQKEGTYLIQLIVNQSLSSEVRDTVIAAVRHVKTRDRIPAAGETEENGQHGWAKVNGVNALLRRVIDMRADPGLVVGVCGAGVGVNFVCEPTDLAVLKSGLPGEEQVAIWTPRDATIGDVRNMPLAVYERAVDGSLTTGPGTVAYFRVFGIVRDVFMPGVSLGDYVYVDDLAQLATAAGTFVRPCGRVIGVPAASTGIVWFNGLGGDN